MEREGCWGEGGRVVSFGEKELKCRRDKIKG